MHVGHNGSNAALRSGTFSDHSLAGEMAVFPSLARQTTFHLPSPIATEVLTMTDGASIRLRRFGIVDAPRIVLSYGNGLAINAYAPFCAPLAERYDVVVFDMRNHGENPLHEESKHRWPAFISDIEEIALGIAQKFGPAKTIGAFHSEPSFV
jgi:alpha-beta hydrolase superfamily lysophospholipase